LLNQSKHLKFAFTASLLDIQNQKDMAK